MARTQIRFTVPEPLHAELEQMAEWLSLGNANEVGRHLMMVAYHSTQNTRAMRDQTDVVQAMLDAVSRAESAALNDAEQKRGSRNGELAHL